MVFHDVSHFNLVCRYRCSREICCLHLQGMQRLLNLEMEVAESFKMVIPINQNTRCHILEDRYLEVTNVSTSYPLQSHCLISNYSYSDSTVYIVYTSHIWCAKHGYHCKACNI
jgi:hypothetical protein